MPPLSLNEILSLRHTKQYFHDCYLVSSLHALTQSENGIKLLQKNITKDEFAYNILFDGAKESIRVTDDDLRGLEFLDKYYNYKPPKEPYNPILKAVEVAMSKLLSKYPSNKPWYCHLAKGNEKFEYNFPSKFMQLFTGKIPNSVNEKTINMKISSKTPEAMDLFEKIENSGTNNSFVAGTGLRFFTKLPDIHVFVLKQVDLNAGKVHIHDSRTKQDIVLSVKDALDNLKYITGYFNEDLK